MEIHHSEALQYEQSKCDEIFSRVEALHQHMEIHYNREVLLKYSNSDKDNLVAMEASDTVKRIQSREIFKFSICDMAFPRNFGLIYHQAIHTHTKSHHWRTFK